jgi:hypothetical protein
MLRSVTTAIPAPTTPMASRKKRTLEMSRVESSVGSSSAQRPRSGAALDSNAATSGGAAGLGSAGGRAALRRGCSRRRGREAQSPARSTVGTPLRASPSRPSIRARVTWAAGCCHLPLWTTLATTTCRFTTVRHRFTQVLARPAAIDGIYRRRRRHLATSWLPDRGACSAHAATGDATHATAACPIVGREVTPDRPGTPVGPCLRGRGPHRATAPTAGRLIGPTA